MKFILHSLSKDGRGKTPNWPPRTGLTLACWIQTGTMRFSRSTSTMRGLKSLASASSIEAYATMLILSPGIASRAAAPFTSTVPDPCGASVTNVAKRAPVCRL